MNVRTPTCKVDTSTGPLSCPTRKNSTVTVLSVRREVPARWLNSGKARARAQAEAKASDRSHTICSTERQSCAEDGRGARAGPGRRLQEALGLTAGSDATVHTAGHRRPHRGSPPNHCLHMGEGRHGHQGLPTAFQDRTWRDEQQTPVQGSELPPRPIWEKRLSLSGLSVPVRGRGDSVGAAAASEPECSAVTLRSPCGHPGSGAASSQHSPRCTDASPAAGRPAPVG